MFMEDMAIMGFGFPLLVLLLAFLPMFFTGTASKVAPGIALTLFLLGALFFVGFAAGASRPAEVAPLPHAEEQMLVPPPR